MKALVQGVCVAVALLVGAGLAQAQDNIKLRYKMKEGEQLPYRKTQKMQQTQTVNNTKVETDIASNEVTVWNLEKVDDKGNLQIKTKNKQLDVKVKIGPLGEYTFDSKKKENDKGGMLGGSLTPLYERLSGSSINITISPQGEVKDIKGLKELLGDVLQGNPIAEQFAGGGSEDAAKVNMAEFVPYLPDKAISAGDKWETPFELNMPKIGKAKGKKVYWYQGEGTVGKVKTAKIDIAQEMNFDLNLNMDGAKVTGMLSITNSKGTIHFDPQRGIVVSMTAEYTLSGNINVSINGMDIPVATEQTQTITMELLDALPK
jgi:hypothetical protein